MAARSARAHQEDSARARHGPSEASVKFFDETFFQKSFDLALALTGRAAHKRKLGKQRSVFPGRWGSERVVPRGWVASYRCALSVLANASPLSPAGSGDAAQWAAPITDRRGSRDAGTAPAVTERALHKQKDTQPNPGCPSFFILLRLPYSTSTVQPKVSSTLPV